MSAIDITNPTKNTVTEGVRATVTVKASWPTFSTAPGRSERSFDPRAAGRRAVRKHSDALRRLSN
jgi:hypothetical protein